MKQDVAYIIKGKEHGYSFMWWINWKSWGFTINFVDGFMLQFLCFFLEIDKSW